MQTADQKCIPRRRLVRSQSSRGFWWCLSPLGWIGGFVAGFVLVATGLQLGRTFSNASGLDTPAQMGPMPETSYPCGVEIPCFEKGRYQPIWL